jgi:hypothetical protein
VPRKSKMPPGRGKTSANEQGKGFGQIPRVLTESSAYRAISTLAAAKALPVFLVKFCHAEAIIGRPECEFHYAEAQALHGIPRKSFSRGLPELHSLGLIDVVTKGGEWEGNQWAPTVFRRSERWRKYGTADFVSVPWVKSEPSQKATPPPRKRRRDGNI